MRRGRRRGVLARFVWQPSRLRGVPEILRGCTRVQEHDVLQERALQPLQHLLQEQETFSDRECGCGENGAMCRRVLGGKRRL